MTSLPLSIPLAIAASHPAFEGHFPTRPILPGVVLLDHGLRAIDAQRPPSQSGASCRIGAAKFLSFVGPGEPLRLELERTHAAIATKEDWRLRIHAGPPGEERIALTCNVSFDVIVRPFDVNVHPVDVIARPCDVDRSADVVDRVRS